MELYSNPEVVDDEKEEESEERSEEEKEDEDTNSANITCKKCAEEWRDQEIKKGVSVSEHFKNKKCFTCGCDLI